jgi:hypothetical protein
MKTNLFRSLVGMAIVCVVFSLSVNLFAGLAPSGELLVQAYTNLEQADHDYKGRRAEAMKAIEKAGKELGVAIGGKEKVHEKQGISDEHLHAAQSLLEQARGNLSGKALKHVDKAIEHISTALKIK